MIRTACLLVLSLAPAAVYAQAKTPAKAPDLVVFTNGEQLTGELETASADGITFKSAMAGEIKVGWANIKSLTSLEGLRHHPGQGQTDPPQRRGRRAAGRDIRGR